MHVCTCTLSLSLAFHCPANPLNKVMCAAIGQEDSKWGGQPCLSCCAVHVLWCVMLLRIINLYHFCTFVFLKPCVVFYILKRMPLFVFSITTFLSLILQPATLSQVTPLLDANKQTSV